MIPGIISAILIGGLSWFLLPFFWRKRREARLARLCQTHGLIALTYDDGPGQTLTSKLITLLETRHVQASFFVLGKHAAARPELIRDLVAHGHEVGHHTHDHSNAWKTAPWTMARDLAHGIRTVTGLGGAAHLFRPPYGKVTIAGLIQGYASGLTHAFWSVDTRDSWARRPTREVLDEIGAKGGGVVLMHDYDDYDAGGDGSSHEDHVLSLTGAIIDFARARGLKIVRFSEIETHAARPAAKLLKAYP